MNIQPQKSNSGIALIIVMICITVLGMLAAAFAYQMKVENKLAMNANAEDNFYTLALSGIDYCKAVLAGQLACTSEQYDSLNQIWAHGSGGDCTTNGVLVAVQFTKDMGYGKFTWNMVDMESMRNINSADPGTLDRAMQVIGLDPGDSSAISASIIDWIDKDKNNSINGTESDYYETLDPPYKAKDGYMDDISELLFVRGVTREIFNGENQAPSPSALDAQLGIAPPGGYRSCLTKLFTPISTGLININTASSDVLQTVPFIDQNTAEKIIGCRNGPEGGIPVPFRTPGEALNCAGVNPQIIPQILPLFEPRCRSRTFEVHIDVEIKNQHRHYYAVIVRNSPTDLKTLTFNWSLDPRDTSHADAR